MNKQERSQMIYDALHSSAAAEGLDLIDVEVKGQTHNPIIIVFLDLPTTIKTNADGKNDKRTGIGIAELTAANRWIDLILDELIATRYTLEVSSPGGRKKRESKMCD